MKKKLYIKGITGRGVEVTDAHRIENFYKVKRAISTLTEVEEGSFWEAFVDAILLCDVKSFEIVADFAKRFNLTINDIVLYYKIVEI